MIHEIRNYHYEPTLFAQYCDWAKNDAIAYLRKHLNIVGFWLNNGSPSEIRGAAMDPLGSANVTWIIGWTDMRQREETMAKVFATPEWNAIFAKSPAGVAGYLRMESKFTQAI